MKLKLLAFIKPLFSLTKQFSAVCLGETLDFFKTIVTHMKLKLLAFIKPLFSLTKFLF